MSSLFRSMVGGFIVCFGATAFGEDASCKYVKLATLPVAFNGISPTVPGSIDGKATKMLLDTGAVQTLMTKAGTDRLGLDTKWGGYQSVIGAGGESDVRFAYINSIEIGQIKGAGQYLAVIQEGTAPDGIDGLVGANFLYQADLELNLAKNEISFFQAVGCAQNFLAYWDSNAFSVPAGPMSKVDRRQVFNVRLNGTAVPAIIDTGAPFSIIDLRIAKGFGFTPGSPGVVAAGKLGGIGGKTGEKWIVSLDSFAIGPEVVHGAHLLIGDLFGGASASGDIRLAPLVILGVDFLRAHHVLFAIGQRRVYLTYNGGDVFLLDQIAAAGKATPLSQAATPQPLAAPSQLSEAPGEAP